MKNKQIMMIVGGLVLVAVLVAGAFTAVRLLAKPAEAEHAPNVKVFEDVMNDGNGPVTVTTIVEPSPDLPQRPSETSGVFVRREDNSLYVGTGSISVNVQVVNGETSVAADHSGPEVEVVLTHDTQFFRDETNASAEGITESGERRLTQEIVPVDSMDEAGEGYSLEVWGEKSGDRVIAEIVVFGEVQ